MKPATVLIALLALTIGCRSGETESEIPARNSALSINTIDIPRYFNFETRKRHQVEIVVRDIQGRFLPNARIEIFGDLKTITGGPTEDAEMRIPFNRLAQGYTDSDGRYTESLTLPVGTEKVYVSASVFGMNNLIAVDVVGNKIQLTL